MKDGGHVTPRKTMQATTGTRAGLKTAVKLLRRLNPPVQMDNEQAVPPVVVKEVLWRDDRQHLARGDANRMVRPCPHVVPRNQKPNRRAIG